MAQASKRATPRETQLRSVYDNEPSMSLELFGYNGVVVDGDGDGDGDTTALHQLAFDDNFKDGCGSADYYSWAYSASGGSISSSSSSSSSSVLSFEQAGTGGRELAYNAAAGGDCALWMISAAGMVDHQHGAAKFGFVNPGSAVDVGLEIQETNVVKPPPARAAQKRACPGGEAKAAGKKRCGGGGGRKSKAKAAPTKDPQSVAAKVRRELISERLKVLQDLVPNGTKVDLVTMLEKAINYVKFLQLQVRCWLLMTSGLHKEGKHQSSQVKDALDAILSSQHPNK